MFSNMTMNSSAFNSSKFKSQLKMACGRMEIIKNKKSALLKQNMRQIAVMLAEDPPQEEKAFIRTEALVRDDNLIEALEIIQLHCELLQERVKLIEYTKDGECPTDLAPVINTIMWSTNRIDNIPELVFITKQLMSKFGSNKKNKTILLLGRPLEDFAGKENTIQINERVVTKLSIQPPAPFLVQVYLEKICGLYDVDWKPSSLLSSNQQSSDATPISSPMGYSVSCGQGTGLGPTTTTPVDHSGDLGYQRRSMMSSTQNTSSTTNQSNDNNNNNRGGGGGGSGGMMSFLTKFTKSNNTKGSSSTGAGGIKASTGTSTRYIGAVDDKALAPKATIHGQYAGTDTDYQEIDVIYAKPPPATAPPGSMRRGLTDVTPIRYCDDSREDNNNNDDEHDDSNDKPSSSSQRRESSTNNNPYSTRNVSQNNTKYTSERDLFMESAEYADLAAKFSQLTK